jgi:hypothetical protein
MACVDFKSAFDSCKHDFIWQTLERFNLGPQLIKHVQTLYNDSKSSVLNHNTRTNWFPLAQSARQGDPIAGYIFILLLEVLINKIRHEIPALTASNFSVCCLVYADDLTVFLKSAADLTRLLKILRDFAPISGLQINTQKSEVMELGISAEGCGMGIKSELTITGIIYAKDSARMSDLNWSKCCEKVKKKLDCWSGRRMTIIGKANILRAQIQPLISFLGAVLEMPDCILKKLNTLCARFAWNGPDKEKRSLTYKKLEDGGLNIPDFKSRLVAQKCIWIKRLQSGNGVFKQAFRTDEQDWDNPATFLTPYPATDSTDFVDCCIRAWTENLKLLELDKHGLLWPHLIPETQKIVKLKCPTLTIFQSMYEDTPGLNFLQCIRINRETHALTSKSSTYWLTQRHAVRKARFKHLLPIPWNSQNAEIWKQKETKLAAKYGARRLIDFNSQRELYWLSVDQILPRPHPFRNRIDAEATAGMDWEIVDSLKLFSISSMQAFNWRSTHGKLYAKSDLFRFNYVIDAMCDFCNHPKQNISHIYTKCPPIQYLFDCFNHEYKVSPALSDTEKEIGVDTNHPRTKLLLKRLSICRKYLYDCIHAGCHPKWDEVLNRIDQVYVLEYAVADKHGTIHKVLREWEL